METNRIVKKWAGILKEASDASSAGRARIPGTARCQMCGNPFDAAASTCLSCGEKFQLLTPEMSERQTKWLLIGSVAPILAIAFGLVFAVIAGVAILLIFG